MISILVPTMNRPDFVLRLLRYYERAGFKGTVLIGDSSEPRHFETIRKAAEECAGRLNVIARHLPGASLASCMKRLSDEVTSPYVVPVPDDDFIVPRAMNQCAAFLDKNSDYVAAHGYGISFDIGTPGPYGAISSVGRYPQRGFEGSSAAERLTEFFRNYSVTVFSVHRTEAWRVMWGESDHVPDVPIASEILPCALSVVLGKVKSLPILYLARQMHDRRYATKDRYETIVSARWYPSVTRMTERVAETLAGVDRIPLADAQAVVKRELWLYLASILGHQWDKFYGRSPRRNFKARIRETPLLGSALRIAQRFSPQQRFTLREMTKSSSPFHADFDAIAHVVTAGMPAARER